MVVDDPRVAGRTSALPAAVFPASGWCVSMIRPDAASYPPQKLSGWVAWRTLPEALPATTIRPSRRASPVEPPPGELGRVGFATGC